MAKSKEKKLLKDAHDFMEKASQRLEAAMVEMGTSLRKLHYLGVNADLKRLTKGVHVAKSEVEVYDGQAPGPDLLKRVGKKEAAKS